MKVVKFMTYKFLLLPNIKCSHLAYDAIYLTIEQVIMVVLNLPSSAICVSIYFLFQFVAVINFDVYLTFILR